MDTDPDDSGAGGRSEARPVELPVELDHFRDYLRFLARTQLFANLQGKVDPSDIVQETFLQAHRNLHSFQGRTTQELAGWLRQILARNLMQAARHYSFDKRNIKRELSVEQQLANSSAVLGSLLAQDGPAPSDRITQEERALQLAAQIERLPEAQREAIIMHYWQNLPLKEIAEQLDRSPEAVAGLIFRGLRNLRQRLPGDT
ncbi:MAG: sigma-70 family RNA polymerase sigma factor [Pirellulales bacterium]